MRREKNNFAFTVPEIIIIFCIIIVVAMLTFSNRVIENRTQKSATGLKSIMMTLNNAISLNFALDGVDFRNLDSGDENNVKSIYYMLKQRLFVSFVDSSPDDVALLGPNFGSSNFTLFLNDGMVISWPRAARNCTKLNDKLCRMVVDVNGLKGPNSLSMATEDANKNLVKDQFVLKFFNHGFLPYDSKAKYVLSIKN